MNYAWHKIGTQCKIIHFLFIAIPFPVVETCVTLVWISPIFVCFWGAHTSLLWCMVCIQVVGWGGNVTFPIKAPLNYGPMRWCFRVSVSFHKKAPICYRHFVQYFPWPWLFFLDYPKEPLQSLYEGCSCSLFSPNSMDTKKVRK